MRYLFVFFALIAVQTAAADESRFNPPHRGSYLGLRVNQERNGYHVNEVLAKGAAQVAGIEEGDIIVRAGNWRFDPKGPTLAEHLSGLDPGPITVQVLRDGSELDLQARPDPLLVHDAMEITRIISSNSLFREGLSKMVSEGAGLENRLIRAVRETRTRERAYEKINAIIDRFNLSHTAIITPWVSDNLFGSGDHFHLGAFFQQLKVNGEERYFVRSMMFGSPAREAGLLIGDEIISINDISFKASPRKTLAGYEDRRKMYAVQVDRNETLAVQYRREKNGPTESVEVTANKPLSGPASVKKSVQVIPTEGEKTVGYIHLWDFMSGETVSILRKALKEDFKNSQALAIDLRGRGGKVMVINQIAQTFKTEFRPIALLIDREARSAKEMLAHRLQGKPNITLVGETSAGAVLPANFFKLHGGARLMIPNQRGDSGILPFMKNQRLEGRGAIPDLKAPSSLPYSSGRDFILEQAIQLLNGQVSGALLRI